MNLSGRKKRWTNGIWLAVPVIFLMGILAGCGKAEKPGKDQTESLKQEGKIKVVTTLFPYYDFTRQIAGDRVELSMVIPAGMDSHSFEPTPRDIRTMQNADVIIANGGAMEIWVSQVMDSMDHDAIRVVTMMDYVDIVEEEVVEGMEDSGEEHDHEEEGPYEIEYDEHIWTSPVNAMCMVKIIADTLMEEDPENAAYYEENSGRYLKKLEALDQEFTDIRSNAIHDIMIMGDKFPLRYFADQYDLRYRAAFSGCSSDTEPSAKTIAYLIDKVREEKLPVIYYLELSSHRVAEIISEETGAKPLLFHSCHNVTRREFEDGVTYLELMEQNVKNLREGLCK